MKDIIIKHILLIFFSLSLYAKNYTGIDEVIKKDAGVEATGAASHAKPPIPIVKKQKIKDIKLKKDKKGNFIVDWGIFAEYDLKTKKPGLNLKKVVNKKIMTQGYVIPLDFSKKTIKEFLLVPYIPSCNHVPPPPENMIINVKMKTKKGLKPSFYPVEIIGKLKLKKSKKSSSPYAPEGVFEINASMVKEVKE